MPESFLMLLAAGVMLAAAISDPRQVTLHWLRLAGIIALSMAGLSIFFLTRRIDYTLRDVVGFSIATAAILGQLAFVQIDRKLTQRVFAVIATIAGVVCVTVLFPPHFATAILSTAGIAAMTGLCLMDMLLGHAYLTASKMTMAPFARLNNALALTTVGRILTATAVALSINSLRPVEMLWPIHGLYILTRYVVGLLVPAIFVYMARDCINRRATQSATGILYVCGVLVFIGELTALYLLRETGLPF